MSLVTMLRCFAAVGFIGYFASLAAGVCPAVEERRDCGNVTTTREQCLQNVDCSWDENQTPGAIWCCYKDTSLDGSSYVRWGRTSCAGDASLVYKGHAAGSHWTHSGSGGNLICLHEDPQWSNPQPGQAFPLTTIYGVEYETYGGAANIFSTANTGGGALLDNPAPCAGCYVPRSTTMMIPARTDCPAGWTKEYTGFIVSSYYSHYRLDYECWDAAPEIAAGATAQNQAVIYPVEMYCGSLPCSIYTNGNELTCVVCSK